jgi:uncharacterized protein with NRDE domain
MCLILLSWRSQPGFPLVVAANRDEFHLRPAAPASFWRDRPDLLGGRDLEAMGTWMGVARDGRFAAVTNYRGAHEPRAAESRGQLVSRYLANGAAPGRYIAGVAERGSAYSGFNLLCSDDEELWWFSNRGPEPRRLEPGLHALGNDLLDTQETAPHKECFARAIDGATSLESLFEVLAAARIIAPEYGTRCSTVLLRAADGMVQLAERTFDARGAAGETVRFEFRVSPAR